MGDTAVLRAGLAITCLMLVSSILVYELPYNAARVDKALSIISAFGIGSLMFNEDEKKEDERRGRSRLGLCLGALLVIMLCYTLRIAAEGSGGAATSSGLAAAVLLNFLFDCYVSNTPRRMYANGTDNIMLGVVLSARAHQETFMGRQVYVYVPPCAFGALVYLVTYRRLHERITLAHWLKTLLIGAKQGIVVYTIVVELSSHVLDGIADHDTTYGALAALAVAGPITSWVAGASNTRTAAAAANDRAMGCLEKPPPLSRVVPEAAVIY